MLSCTNTVVPMNREGVCGFILENVKIHPSLILTALSSDFPAAGKVRQVTVEKLSRDINCFKTLFFYCENTGSH